MTSQQMAVTRWTIWREKLCGLIVLAVGLVGAAEALKYAMGSPMRMGPGFLPMAYALSLAALGAGLMLIPADRDPSPAARPRIRPLIAVGGAMLTWVYLAPRWGFVVATMALVLVAAAAEREPRPIQALIVGFLAGLAGGFAFVHGFGVALPLWPVR